MKRAILIAAAAAVLFCGCTIDPKGSKKSGKPQARSYLDASSAAPDIYVPTADDTGEEPQYGQPLVYKDFVVGDNDFLGNNLNSEQRLFSLIYAGAYDENDERYRDVDFLRRMTGGEKKQDVLDEYNAEEMPYYFFEDKLYLYSYITDTQQFMLNAYHADSYCDVIMPISAKSVTLEQYAGIRFYFEGDDIVMVGMFINYDCLLLGQTNNNDMLEYDLVSYFSPEEPDGEMLIPRAMLKGMKQYEKLRTDIDYPTFSFDNGYVTVQWYDSEGNKTDGGGILKSGSRLKYTFSENSIDFELPEGGNNMETYIAYNKYLDAFELHDPYWRDNYGCTLMLGKKL